MLSANTASTSLMAHSPAICLFLPLPWPTAENVGVLGHECPQAGCALYPGSTGSHASVRFTQSLLCSELATEPAQDQPHNPLRVVRLKQLRIFFLREAIIQSHRHAGRAALRQFCGKLLG